MMKMVIIHQRLCWEDLSPKQEPVLRFHAYVEMSEGDPHYPLILTQQCQRRKRMMFALFTRKTTSGNLYLFSVLKFHAKCLCTREPTVCMRQVILSQLLILMSRNCCSLPWLWMLDQNWRDGWIDVWLVSFEGFQTNFQKPRAKSGNNTGWLLWAFQYNFIILWKIHPILLLAV